MSIAFGGKIMVFKKKIKSNDVVKSSKNKANIIGKTGNNEKSKEDIITNWIYMTPQTVDAKMIADIIKTRTSLEVDIWEELDILEVELSDKSMVDFEPMETNMKDPSDAAFVKNRNIKTIFAVTISDGAFEEMKSIMKFVIGELEGFICADSVDFNPIYDASSI
jgi:hypothetical protein